MRELERLVSIRKFILAWLLLVVLIIISCIVFNLYERSRQQRAMVRQRVIVKALETHIGKGGQLPSSLSEIAILEYTSGIRKKPLSPIISEETQKRDLKYYPDAWGKPGKIVLQSDVLGLYALTFGDGSFALLKCWEERSKRPIRQVANETQPEYLYGSDYFPELPLLLLFSLLLISFCAILVTERIMKKRISRPSY